jgi:Tol biopolymer transport system component
MHDRKQLTRHRCTIAVRLQRVAGLVCLMGCPQLLDDDFALSASGGGGGGSAGGASRGGSGGLSRGGSAGRGAIATSGAAGDGAGPDATPDAATGSCSDSVLNQDETGVDCGGVCRACSCVFGPFSTPEPVTGLGRTGELWGANLSADGRWLAFSELSAGSEDVYLAERDSEAAFLPATAASGINTAASEGTPAQSGDGLSLYFYAIRGPAGGRDIFVATRLGLEQDYAGATSVPGVNSPGTDHLPWISRDGLRLYFASTRPGGAGNSDIYIATRMRRDGPFSPPQNVTALNATSTDDGAALSSDELSLVFPSNRGGDFAIYGSTRRTTSEPFAPPVLVEELDSAGYEGNVALSSDGLEVIFTSDRDGPPTLYRALRQCL